MKRNSAEYALLEELLRRPSMKHPSWRRKWHGAIARKASYAHTSTSWSGRNSKRKSSAFVFKTRQFVNSALIA